MIEEEAVGMAFLSMGISLREGTEFTELEAAEGANSLMSKALTAIFNAEEDELEEVIGKYRNAVEQIDAHLEELKQRQNGGDVSPG